MTVSGNPQTPRLPEPQKLVRLCHRCGRPFSRHGVTDPCVAIFALEMIDRLSRYSSGSRVKLSEVREIGDHARDALNWYRACEVLDGDNDE